MLGKKSRFVTATISTAIFVLLTQMAVAQTYSVFYPFTGLTNGSQPNGELIQDEMGNFYGTTRYGGTGNEGTIFKIDPSGVETVLYSFGEDQSGTQPEAGLFRDPDGNLYGITSGGGSLCCGSVFKLDTSNVLTTLHSFGFETADGSFPYANRLISVNGVLYGTTSGGGSGTGQNGVVFKITKGGKYSVVYDFTDGVDGASPGYLNRDAAGNIYGTTPIGSAGPGNIFKIDTSGNFSVLYTFTGGADGGTPSGRLIIDANGNIHGAAKTGGDLTCKPAGFQPGCGVIYRLAPDGTQTVLRTFHAGDGGEEPVNGVQDVAGILYGANSVGADFSCNHPDGCGVLYDIGKTGEYSVLHTFTGGSDGLGITGELTLGQDGSIYGSVTGGDFNSGYIFKYTR